MSTWILLRGLTREARHWGEFPDHLARHVPGATVHCVDLPGNGRHAGRVSPVEVADLLGAVRSELIARGVAPPYHLLALSLGAMVAVEWCARHPQELSAAVLLNTSLRPFNPIQQRLRPSRWPTLLRLLLDLEGDRASERRVLHLTSSGDHTANPSRFDDWVAWRRECRVSRANALRQLVAAARYRAPPLRPAVPLLVLGSAGDRLVDPRCSRVLARRWGTAFALHPSAGHDLPLDDAPWVIERVRAWLQAGRASPTSASI